MTEVRSQAPAGVDVELLAQIVQVSADGIFCQDVNGTLISWNPAAERVYGYRAQDVLGLHGDLLMPAETRGQLQLAHQAALAGERVERFDTEHLCRDGSRITVNVSVAPLRDRDGRVVAVATTAADVTARVELAAELERTRGEVERHNVALTRSNRDLEQFAYVASHDLSEPLRVMTGYVDQIERRYDDVLDERGLRYMQHIVDASRRMRALIDDLLEYSRFLRTEHDSSSVDTGAVVAQVLTSLASRIEAAGATVEVGELPAVWSEPQQLESLLLNLLSNALKFSRPHTPPVVSVAGTVDGAWATLTVDDNGIGIAPEYRQRVFRMFQRLHVREAYGGTGIGLAIAQQIVELHGGRIWIEESPAGGARFAVTLPVEPAVRGPVRR